MLKNDGIPWNDERVEKLKKLWGEGKSATEIAAALGGFEHCKDSGRNAVIGKIHRLELPKHVASSSKGPKLKPVQEPKPARARTSAPGRYTPRAKNWGIVSGLKPSRPIASNPSTTPSAAAPAIRKSRPLSRSEERSPFPTAKESGLPEDILKALEKMYERA